MADRSPVEEFLRTFLDEESGSLDWKGLASAIGGSVFVAALTGVIRVPLAFGEAVERGVRPVRVALSAGGGQLADEIDTVGSQAWGVWDFGFATLPVTLAFVLLTFLITAWGWNRYA